MTKLLSLNAQRRLLHRALAHHLPLLAASAVSVYVLYLTRPYKDVITKISFATAYPSLVLLAVTLIIGPWNVLRGQRNPISTDLRRDVGIWAGILGLIHSVVGQNVHLRGRFWLYYFYEPERHHAIPLRHDLFGFANYTGLVGGLILSLLLASSNDYSLRALGTPRWKQLQRWNYAVFGLVTVHAIAYQINEKQKPSFVVMALASIAVTIVLQVLGFRRRRRHALLSF